MLSRPALRLLRSRNLQCCAFSRTAFAPSRATTATQVRKPTSISKSSGSKAALRSPPPPQSPAASSLQGSRIKGAAERLLADKDEVLLYKAPSHTSLAITSMLSGTLFMGYCSWVGAGFLATNFSWLFKAPVVLGLVSGIAIGAAMFATPLRQLHKISLVRDPSKGILLRFQPKRDYAHWLPKRFDATLDEVKADRTVRAAGLKTYNVLPQDRVEWTAMEKQPDKLDRSLAARKERFWENLTSLFPTLARDTRKMISREGMLYMRIKNQNWKVDLTGCVLLDDGKSLASVVSLDKDVRDSFIGIFRRYLSAV